MQRFAGMATLEVSPDQPFQTGLFLGCPDECWQEPIGKLDARANPATPRRQGSVRIDQGLASEKNQLSRQPRTILPIPSQNCVILRPGIPPVRESAPMRYVAAVDSSGVALAIYEPECAGDDEARHAAHPSSSRKRRLIAIQIQAVHLCSFLIICISGLP